MYILLGTKDIFNLETLPDTLYMGYRLYHFALLLIHVNTGGLVGFFLFVCLLFIMFFFSIFKLNIQFNYSFSFFTLVDIST